MTSVIQNLCRCCNCNMNRKIDEGELEGLNKVDFHCAKCIDVGVNG